MFLILLIPLCLSVDIHLNPLVEALPADVPALSLTTADYYGSNISPRRASLEIHSKSDRDIVLLKSYDRYDYLFNVAHLKLRLTNLSLLAPESASLIHAYQNSTVELMNVFHAYTYRPYSLIFVDLSAVYIFNNTFMNGSRFGEPIVKYRYAEQRPVSHNVTLEQCVISDILLLNESPFAVGITASHVTVIDCIFNRVLSNSTRAPYLDLPFTLASSTFKNVTFNSCHAPLAGGLFYGVQSVECFISNVNVTNCSNSVIHSWMNFNRTTNVSISDSSFTGCYSSQQYPNGSALYIPNSANLWINGTKFRNNTALAYGGSIWVNGTVEQLSINQTSFASNVASFGGAISVRKLSSEQYASFSVMNSVFTNRAQLGSDLHFEEMGTRLTESNFSKCQSRSASARIYDAKTRKGFDWTNTR
ncbi:hypothetical protein BLNAU_15246 [Blattamonas nauphoetae]|uniref:Right handed beta helix domain-containing protein n=1 Tax=Blattamonas nauphoetae TaxID=2049346 RepID=A0ABQ9XBF1_9EUKA|nr:hypothetical protein BLNAU_15246 [Blattamonas nauphoetae]